MFYITKCYVGHAGTTLRPGEAFEADGRDEKIKRLLRLGAIVPATPAFAPVGGDEDNDDQADQENDCQQMENLGDDASGEPLDEEEPEEESIDIDGLDGIVEASAEEPAPVAAPAPKKTHSKRA